MSQFLAFCKREIILIISAVAAVISCVFVPVTDYIQYVDTDMISILFCLMVVVAGFSQNNVFKRFSQILIGKCGNTRSLTVLLVMMTFFSSVFITNDVSLITFVPFTILTLASKKRYIPFVITIQTIAANLGSALTPTGSPHNLYLFSAYEMSVLEFLKITFPIFAISLFIIFALSMFVKKETVEATQEEKIEISNKSYLYLYCILFVLCLLSVFKVIDVMVVLVSVMIVVAIAQPRLFFKADYGLLVTFVFFFIFIGNIQNIEPVREFLTSIINEREFISSIALSQVISNVPTAVMMSGFTDKASDVILGCNIGGLGTIMASLASLISFKVYSSSEEAETGKYMAVFSIVNFLVLIILFLITYKFFII